MKPTREINDVEILRIIRNVARLGDPAPSVSQRALEEILRKAEQKPARSTRCQSCGTYAADPPSRLCPGCEAYAEHQR